MTCENNSTCLRVSAAQYKCHCAEGYTGKRCEFLQTVNFDKDSFIPLPSTATRRNFSMRFSFTTTIKNGLILYQGKVRGLARFLITLVKRLVKSF